MRAANQLAAGMGVWEDPKGGLKDPRGVLKDSLGIRGEIYGSREPRYLVPRDSGGLSGGPGESSRQN